MSQRCAQQIIEQKKHVVEYECECKQSAKQ